MTDKERLDWFDKIVSEGVRPAIVNDDDGRWAVAFDGVQDFFLEEGPYDIRTSFFIRKKYWKNSIREAIDFAINNYLED